MTMVEVTDSGVVPLVYADGEDESSGPGDSVVQVMVGDQLYPASFRQQCRVCQSPHRGYIEAEIARGTFYASIERSMDGWNTGTLPPPSARSMGNHMASFHAPLTQVIKRKQMEQVYEKSGGEIDEAADHHVNRVVVAHAIIKRYHDQMAADEKEKVTTADLALAVRAPYRPVAGQSSAGDRADSAHHAGGGKTAGSATAGSGFHDCHAQGADCFEQFVKPWY